MYQGFKICSMLLKNIHTRYLYKLYKTFNYVELDLPSHKTFFSKKLFFL